MKHPRSTRSVAQIDPRRASRDRVGMGFEDEISAPVAVRTFTFNKLFIGCERPLKLQSKHAGFSNPGLTSAQLKAFNERQARRGSSSGTAVTPEMIEADRILDAQLFAKHVVTGWDDEDDQGKPVLGPDGKPVPTVYEDGKPVPFSVNKCQELLLAISKKRLDYFRDFTRWGSDGDNFTDGPAVGDPANLGK